MMHAKFDHRAAHQAHLRHTKPSITAEARRLIDEAVAAGRVTRIPSGVSGLPVTIFDGAKNAIVNKVSDNWLDRHRARIADGTGPRNVTENQAVARRKRMLQMHRAGKSTTAIAQEFGVNVSTVRKGIRIAKLAEIGGKK